MRPMLVGLDTNVLVRLAVGDLPAQARIARDALDAADRDEVTLLMQAVTVAETVWVLESFYGFGRADLADFLDALLAACGVLLPERDAVQRAVLRFREQGDFADLLVAESALDCGARRLLSFDQGLAKAYPGFVTVSF